LKAAVLDDRGALFRPKRGEEGEKRSLTLPGPLQRKDFLLRGGEDSAPLWFDISVRREGERKKKGRKRDTDREAGLRVPTTGPWSATTRADGAGRGCAGGGEGEGKGARWHRLDRSQDSTLGILFSISSIARVVRGKKEEKKKEEKRAGVLRPVATPSGSPCACVSPSPCRKKRRREKEPIEGCICPAKSLLSRTARLSTAPSAS